MTGPGQGKAPPLSHAGDAAGDSSGPQVRVLTLIALILAALMLPGFVLRYQAAGGLQLIHALLCLFLAVNLLICYWEACLFFQRDYIETRSAYWRQRQQAGGRLAIAEFFFGKVSAARVFSPRLWADVWATYTCYDTAFADRKSFGFNADVGNGFVTTIPTVLLYLAFAGGFLPALAAGLLGLMLFWQQTYVTSVYLASFFIAGLNREISRRELCLWVIGSNCPWVLFPLLGLYVSLRLVLDGNYSVLGL